MSDKSRKASLARLVAAVPGSAPDGREPRAFMLEWLSAFAPDMTYRDAKAYCLPRLMYKNHLWHAFSFEKTDFCAGESAMESAIGAFTGKCLLYFEDGGLLLAVEDGSVLTPELLSGFSNVIAATGDMKKTYVYTGEENTGPYYKED